MTNTHADEQPSLAEQANEIAHVVGVMSGKGGVGKSLVTGLLACALRSAGSQVGVLDADVTGPSIPKMFGVSERPDFSELGLFPVRTKTDIRIMSINLLLDRPEEAVIWRGPRISGVVKQFWQEVFWGELDYLLVDLPPGTSDVPLTIMQSLPLDCVVIVTSPQDLAAMVVRKAIDMCRQMETPILGLVQNMAWLKCPSCGEVVYPFGRQDGESLAHDMGVPFLMDIPIDPKLSAASDDGTIETYTANPFDSKVEVIANAVIAASGIKKAACSCAGSARE